VQIVSDAGSFFHLRFAVGGMKHEDFPIPADWDFLIRGSRNSSGASASPYLFLSVRDSRDFLDVSIPCFYEFDEGKNWLAFEASITTGIGSFTVAPQIVFSDLPKGKPGGKKKKKAARRGKDVLKVVRGGRDRLEVR
jgi:hypothetical protein